MGTKREKTMNDTDYGAVFMLVACIGVVAILGIFLTIPPSHPANTLPAGCGVSENQSETYTTHYFIMVGHVMIP
jgi:predicted MFS family arabinose efflux permease